MKSILVLLLSMLSCSSLWAQEVNQVEVLEPGSLAQILEERGLTTAEQLSISGGLNTQDIRTIRHLCGGHDEMPEDEVYTETLRVLDLSEADIVEGDKAEYYYYDAMGTISPNRYINAPNQISWYMFANTTSLEELTLPRSVEVIQAAAFIHSSIRKVYIGSSTHTIRKYAFFDCPELEFVGIPSSAQKVDVCSFSQCPSLTLVKCDATIPPQAVDEEAELLGSTHNPDMSQCVLLVPEGCHVAYAGAEFWRDFKSVVEETTAVRPIQLPVSSEEWVMGVDGIRKDKRHQGVKIVRTSDGRYVKRAR